MKISTKGRYGLRVLLELANHTGNNPVQLKEIAKNQQLSLNYIEHLISPLVSAGFIRTVRGAAGGILLVKKPGDIKVSDVIGLFEGSTALVECVDNPGICNRSDECITRDIWCELKKVTDTVLESKTLLDLVAVKKKRKAETAMYYI